MVIPWSNQPWLSIIHPIMQLKPMPNSLGSRLISCLRSRNVVTVDKRRSKIIIISCCSNQRPSNRTRAGIPNTLIRLRTWIVLWSWWINYGYSGMGIIITSWCVNLNFSYICWSVYSKSLFGKPRIKVTSGVVEFSLFRICSACCRRTSLRPSYSISSVNKSLLINGGASSGRLMKSINESS